MLYSTIPVKYNILFLYVNSIEFFRQLFHHKILTGFSVLKISLFFVYASQNLIETSCLLLAKNTVIGRGNLPLIIFIIVIPCLLIHFDLLFNFVFFFLRQLLY